MAMMKPLSLNAEGHEKSMRLAKVFERFNEDILQIIPHGMETQIISMKTEESCYWAQRALSLDPRYQLEPEQTTPKEGATGRDESTPPGTPAPITPIRGI